MSEKVRSMFADIASDYDRVNTVLSFAFTTYGGTVPLLNPEFPKVKVCWICATGTGDLAIAFKKAVGSEGYVLGTDFAQMIELAPSKAKKEGLEIDFEVQILWTYPYEDNRFDLEVFLLVYET